MWDTPMSKWAGEGKDWKQLMAQGPLPEEDVMMSFFLFIYALMVSTIKDTESR